MLRILTEIGVALTSFGALFMLLGVILFFDGSLLALGNVSLVIDTDHLNAYNSAADLVSVGNHPHHWPSKDVLFLCAEAEITRDSLLPGWHPARILQMAILRCYRRDVWVLEPLWVRYTLSP